MLTRYVKAYSSSSLHSFSLNPAILSQFILGVCAAIKTPYFGSSGSFKVNDVVDTTEKLVTSACCDTQHAHAYLQPFS